MSNRPLRVALVGPGWIARRHLEVLTTEPDVELAGLVASTPERAAAAASEWGTRGYPNVADLLAHERLDAAWVCVPPDQHAAVDLPLIEAGVHLFVEKPLAADVETPEQVAAALAEAGLIGGVAYHWRAMDTLPEVRRAIAANPVRLVTGAWHDSTPGVAWWRRQASGGGQMVEQATHLVDLARALVGEASVIAATADRFDRPGFAGLDVASVSSALLRFEAGPTGAFTATSVLAGPSTVELRLLCEGLAITISREGVRFEEAAAGGVRERFVLLGNDPFRDEDRAFLRAVRTGDASGLFSPYADALRTHRLTTAIRAAAEPGA